MRSEAELDQRHEGTVKRFPGGLTLQQFRLVTLESADDEDEGRVYPPSIQGVPGNPLIYHSLLTAMWFDGLLVHLDDGSGRPQWHQPIRYKITDKGRAELVSLSSLTKDSGGVS